MHLRRPNQLHIKHEAAAGFTILELMVASTVFAVILLVVAMGVVGVTDSYYKGITSSKTQAAARAIMNTIANSIQFGKWVDTSRTGPSGAQSVCIDSTLYSYVIGQEVVDSTPNGSKHQAYHGLIASTAGCNSVSVPNTNTPLVSTSRELLGANMRLAALDVVPAGQGLYTIHVRVLYGDDDLFTPSVTSSGTAWGSELCSGTSGGSQFCAVSDLSTTVQQRLAL